MALDDKHVVITGGSGALGCAVTERFLALNATVHIPYIETAEIAQFPYKDHVGVKLYADIDLSQEQAVVEFYQHLPAIHASVQLAGGFAMANVVETSLQMFMQLMNMNASTCFLCCREAVKNFAQTGCGYLVNVAARPALEPRSGAGMIAYTASKAAVAAMTQSLAEELIKQDIFVNAIAPSIIDTPNNRAAMPQANFDLWPKPNEIAMTISQLCLPSNRVTRGAIVTVYGKS